MFRVLVHTRCLPFLMDTSMHQCVLLINSSGYDTDNFDLFKIISLTLNNIFHMNKYKIK
jgi:hypothetical protein